MLFFSRHTSIFGNLQKWASVPNQFIVLYMSSAYSILSETSGESRAELQVPLF